MKAKYREKARESAHDWYIILTSGEAGTLFAAQCARELRESGLTYCQIRDKLAGVGIK